MTKVYKNDELKKMSDKDLLALVKPSEAERDHEDFALKTNQSKTSHKKGLMRKQVARTKTFLRQKQLSNTENNA